MNEKELNVDELVDKLWDTLKALFLLLAVFIPDVLFFSLITCFAYESWIYPLTAYSLCFADMCGIFMFLAIIKVIFGKVSDKDRSAKDIWQLFIGKILALLVTYGLCSLTWSFIR